MKRFLIKNFELSNLIDIIKSSSSVGKIFYFEVSGDEGVFSTFKSKVAKGGEKFKLFKRDSNFFTTTEVELTDSIHTYIYQDGDSLHKKLDLMEDYVSVEFNYMEVDTEDETLNYTDHIIFEDSRMKLKVNCYDYKIIKHESDPRIRPSDEICDKLLSSSGELVSIHLDKEDISTINNNFRIDKDVLEFDLFWNDKGLFMRGNNYEFLIKSEGIQFEKEGSISINKKSFGIVDPMGYNLTIASNKEIIDSDTTRTILMNTTIGDYAVMANEL